MSLSFAVVTRATFMHKVTLVRNCSEFGKLTIQSLGHDKVYYLECGDGSWLFACVRAPLIQLCLTLCDPMDCSPPGSSVQGILQARILEWVAMPPCRVSFRPWDRIWVSYIAGGFFIAEPWEALMYVYICPNLSD